MKNGWAYLLLAVLCLSSSMVRCWAGMEGIEVIYAPPTAEEFVSLRATAGMKNRKVASAEKGILNSLFWVILRCQGKLIGMGAGGWRWGDYCANH